MGVYLGLKKKKEKGNETNNGGPLFKLIESHRRRVLQGFSTHPGDNSINNSVGSPRT